MNSEDYRQNMDLVTGQVRILAELPVDEMLDDLDRVESFGPFLDPTAMMQPGAFERLRQQKELLQAVRQVQDAVAKIKAEAATPDTQETQHG